MCLWNIKQLFYRTISKAKQAKQNHPSPLAQGLNLPMSTLTTPFSYGKQFKFNDKAIIELELVVTECSVCKGLAYHYGNNNYVQPLEDIKNCSAFLAQIIYYLHDDLSMLLLPCGEGGKDVLS